MSFDLHSFTSLNCNNNQTKCYNSNHHKLLKLVESVKESSALQDLAGGDEVAAKRLQAWV